MSAPGGAAPAAPPARLDAVAADGTRLALWRYRTAGRARAVALLTHAMMANAAYLRRFATFLAARDIEAFALDFRGHGGSAAPRRWSFDDYARLDVPAALAAVAQASGRSAGEVAYVGHSLGGLAGLAAFATHAAPAPQRLVLVAVNCWTRPRAWRRRLAAATFVASAQLARKVPARALGVGTDDEPLAYARQFARWTRHGFASLDGVDYLAALPALLGVPTLAVVSDGDWMCTPDDMTTFLAPLAPRFRCVGPLRGDPFAPDHFGLLTSPRLENLWLEITEDGLA
jgi:predicted alpha/beta hydrolase